MTTPNSETGPYADHPLHAAGQRSRNDRNNSLDALHDLEAALAEPAPNRAGPWVDSICAALDNLQDALDAQAGADRETSSLLSEIETTEPRLIPRIARLRRQHTSLRESVTALRRELAGSEHVSIDVGDIRSRAAEVARQLRHHRGREADLIYEAVTINLGAGD